MGKTFEAYTPVVLTTNATVIGAPNDVSGNRDIIKINIANFGSVDVRIWLWVAPTGTSVTETDQYIKVPGESLPGKMSLRRTGIVVKNGWSVYAKAAENAKVTISADVLRHET